MTVKQSIAGIIAAAAIGGGVYEGTVSEGPVDVVREGELVGARTETAVVYDLGNGQRRAEVSMKPVHWRDGDGWKTIDTAVKAKPILRQLFSSRDYETTAGPYTAEFDNDRPWEYKLTSGDTWIEWSVAFDSTKAITVAVEPTTTGIKETVTLHDDTAPNELHWGIVTNVEVRRENNALIVGDLRVEPPVAWDAEGRDVPVEMRWRDGVYQLTVDTKDAVFPVTVDPTTSVIPKSNEGYIEVTNATWLTGRNLEDGAGAVNNIGINVGVTYTTYYTLKRGYVSFPLNLEDVISVDACSLYVYCSVKSVSGGSDSLFVVGAEDYGPLTDTGDWNVFDGWQSSGFYTGSVYNISYEYSSISASAWAPAMIFNSDGLAAVYAAVADTFRIAMLGSSDYWGNYTGVTNRSVTFNHATNKPYLSLSYTTLDYNTTYVTIDTPGDFFTSKANVSATYVTVRDMQDEVADPPDISTAAVDTLGQMKDGSNNYHVWRANLEVYDLPNLNQALACTLKINLTGDQSATDFDLQVFSGTWNETQNSDYRYWNFNGRQYASAHTGTRLNNVWNTSSYGAGGVINLIFNQAGLDSLVAHAADDTLRFVVISSRDSSNTAPTGNEFVTLNSTSAALAYSWRLNSTEPTGLAITAVATDSVTVTWTDNTLDEDGFDIVETLTGDVITSVAADETSVGVGGLLPNHLYSWRVQVDGGVYDDSLSVADSTYTLAAAPVAAPALTFLSGTAVKVVIDTTGTGNPEWTEYAVQDSLSGKYVDADGDSLRTAADWNSYGGWGATDGDTLTVEVGKTYAFRLKARNDSLDSYSAMATLLDAPLDSLTYTLADSTFEDNSQFDRTIQSARSAVSFSTLSSGLKVMNFNGSTDLIDCGSNFIGTNAVTVEAWIRPETRGESNYGRIIDNNACILFIDGATNKLAFTSNNTTQMKRTVKELMNVWTHVVVTRDVAGLASIYVDGELQGAANSSSGTPSSSGVTNVLIGNRAATDLTFDGDISGVRVYNVILTTTQIYNRYIDTRDAYRD